jgi:hypothetical protein
MVEKSVHQCPGIVSTSGMDYHARWFIEYNYSFIFIDDIQRNLLRRCLVRFNCREIYGYYVFFLNFIMSGNNPVINQYISLGNHLLQGISGAAWKRRR